MVLVRRSLLGSHHNSTHRGRWWQECCVSFLRLLAALSLCVPHSNGGAALLERKAAHFLSRSQSDRSVSASKSATVRLRLLVPALLTAPWHTFRQVLARVTTVVSTLALRSQSIPTHTSPPAPSSHPSHTTPHRREGVGLGLFPSRYQQSVVHCGLQAVYSGLHTASG